MFLWPDPVVPVGPAVAEYGHKKKYIGHISVIVNDWDIIIVKFIIKHNYKSIMIVK